PSSTPLRHRNCRAFARHTPETVKSRCYTAEGDTLARNNSPQCRSPSGRHSDKSPWRTQPRQDWAEVSVRFRLTVALLLEGWRLVVDSVLDSHSRLRMITAPNRARTSGRTEPLL